MLSSPLAALKAHASPAGAVLLACEGLLVLLCYSPYWQTYDDVVLAMLINGYGMADAPAINLLYCNFIWAAIIRLIPDFFGISNYTWAIYASAFAALMAIWIFIARAGGQLLIKFAIISAMLFYAFLNPQFTVSAFFCAIAAVCAFLAWQNSPSRKSIAAAFIFGLLAFLIRDWTLPFAILLALFQLNWPNLFHSRIALVCLLLFGILAAGIYGTDRFYLKSSPEWQKIAAWNRARRSLSDDGWWQVLARQPELAAKHGYSENDLRLLGTHFGLSAPLMDVEKFDAMKAESSFDVWYGVNLDKVEVTFSWFLSWPLILLLVILFLLVMRRFSWRLVFNLALFFGLFFCIGFFNRGGVWISRLYYPALFALICFLLSGLPNTRLEKDIRISCRCETVAICITALLLILAFSKANLVEQWQLSASNRQAALEHLDNSVWYGHPVRLEQLYQPFAPIGPLKKIKFQCASWTTLLPNSRSFFNIAEKDGFDDFYRKGFDILLSPEQLGYLETYCRERLGGEPVTMCLNSDLTFPAWHVSCAGR